MLLTYNPVRYQMIKMAYRVKGNYLPHELSFSGAVAEILRLLTGFPSPPPGPVPGHRNTFAAMPKYLRCLPDRRIGNIPGK